MARFRRELGLSLRELSERLQIPVPTLAGSEYGRNSVSQQVLDRIRAVFPTEAAAIFGDFVPKKPSNHPPSQARAISLLDLEISAMSAVYHTLEPLDDATRKRVIDWALHRLSTKQS